MSEPFIAEIKMFGGNFAPRGWAFCDGQLISISQNQALFSLLGTTYGGDGRSTFGLPDLRGRVAIHPGTGPGLSAYRLGQTGGTETNTMTVSQLPAHSHSGKVVAVSEEGNTQSPSGNSVADDTRGRPYFSGTGTPVNMKNGSVQTDNSGSGQSVNNVQPYQSVNFIIALVGLFPSRN